jgi:hypothetical protein
LGLRIWPPATSVLVASSSPFRDPGMAVLPSPTWFLALFIVLAFLQSWRYTRCCGSAS